MKDHHYSLELKISKLLRIGVILSGTMIALGWFFDFKFSNNIFPAYKEYDPIPLQNFLIYHYTQGNWATLLSYAGLAVLISLPLMRVLLTGILFIRQKDYVLALIAALVLLGLILSFTLGIEL